MIFIGWLFSRKHYQLKIVIATLSVLIMLPVMTLVVFASSGLALVSEALAAVNPITHLVEIFDPNGNKVSEVALSTVWPTRGYTTDEFGEYGQYRMEHHLGPHTGLDIANQYGVSGEPITPFMSGTVIKTDKIGNGTCGQFIRVRHDYHITSLYCHLSAVLVDENKEVKPGDIIGLMGDTGASTAPHLHFQIAVYDIPVNPRTFMVDSPEGSTIR